MGHIRLGTLPKTQKWEHVVGLIAGGADVERIAAASADAAERGLERASQDQGLAHAFWLLTQILKGRQAVRLCQSIAATRTRSSEQADAPGDCRGVHGCSRSLCSHTRHPKRSRRDRATCCCRNADN